MRRLVFTALILPLLLSSFFSAGTMPVFSKQGIEIVICAGDGSGLITVDENGQPIEDDDSRICQWSLPLKAVAAQAHGDLNDIVFDDLPVAFPQRTSFVFQRHASGIYARGPPSRPV